MTAQHLLLVDDEDNLRTMLVAALRHHGFEVEGVGSGTEALRALERSTPDAAVLDVMLPDIDGFEVCRRMRARGIAIPTVFLTARDAVEDRVHGLTIGGDDYLTKPFSLEELVARITAVLRRAGTVPSGQHLSCADLEMDESAHRVTRAGEAVHLSATEFNLLRCLLRNTGRVMSKAQILDEVWRYDFNGDGGVVETYIGYLRRKLDDGHDPKLIHTIRGVGYVMRTNP